MLCSPEAFEKKVEKLSRYYDLSNPRDLFTVTMQEMEIAEIQAKRLGEIGNSKKKHLISLISQIADKQGVKEINLLEAVSAYADDMCRASKKDYLINKETK